jgi:uncharacterized protein YgfB (UPF0149 family)
MENEQSKMPDYEALTQALRRVNSQLSAAECHGLLAAVLYNNDLAISVASMFTDDADALQGDVEFAELVSRLVHCTSAGYRDEGFNFQLLLPADDTPLQVRSQALADWCSGFLMGLFESGLKDLDSLPEDAAEVAKDLVEISQLDVADDNEGTESDLMQLEEYVRVGVQIIYAELTRKKQEEIPGTVQEDERE